jgi:hypothetical protein
MAKRSRVLIGCLLLLGVVMGCGRPEAPRPEAPPIPGWEKVDGGRVALWLPQSFQGGLLSGKNLDAIVEGIRALGPDFEKAAQIIERNPSAFVVFAVDSQVGDSGTLTSMNVVAERVPSAVTVNTYVDIVAKKLSRKYRVVERGIVPLDHYEAGRLVVEIDVQGVSMKSVMYAVKDDGTIWALNYGTGASEFDQRLAAFEQSARTFAVQPQPLWKQILKILWTKFVGT